MKPHIAWVADKENGHIQGMTLQEYADSVNQQPTDALCNLLIEEKLAVLLVFPPRQRYLCRSIFGP